MGIHEDQADSILCPSCGAQNMPAGTLGHVEHVCCRSCGLWYSEGGAA